MGNIYDYNKTPTNIENIENKKDENKDFGVLHELIKKKEENKYGIPCIFKFLKINTFYLGLKNLGIYSRYKEEFESRNLGKKDSVHASLLFSFSNDCNYFLDYYPDTYNSSDEYIHFYNDENKGLRYKSMKMEEFIKYNSVCIIQLKTDKEMNFYDLFEIIYKDNNWRYKDYDLEKKNCCHFGKFILDKLESKLLTGDRMKDFIFTKYIKNSEKEKSIDAHIPKIFFNYFSK